MSDVDSSLRVDRSDRLIDKPDSGEINGLIHRLSVHILLFADILFCSRLYRTLEGDWAQPVLLGACAIITLIYLAFAISRGYVLASSITVGIVGIILVQIFWFASLSGTAVNINAAFQYCWTASFIVFFMVARDGHSSLIARVMLFYASAYVIAYLLLVTAFRFDFLPAHVFSGLISEDDERGQRLFTHIIAAGFAWFYWSLRFKEYRSIANLLMSILCACAILLSLSRVATLIIVLLTTAIFIRLPLRTIGTFCLTVLAICSAILVFGIFNTDWNPFLLFQSDSSGAFRTWEYEVAMDLLRAHPLLGVGIPGTQSDAWAVVKNDFFAAGDLGIIGAWFDLGFLGLLGFIFGSKIICNARLPVADSLRIPLVLVGCMIAAYGCIAPVVFAPSGATYFAALVGLQLATSPKRVSLSARRLLK